MILSKGLYFIANGLDLLDSFNSLGLSYHSGSVVGFGLTELVVLNFFFPKKKKVKKFYLLLIR